MGHIVIISVRSKRRIIILCFVDRAALYNLFQMKPNRCTLLPSIFISTSLHVSGKCVLCMGEKYQCRIDTVSSSDDGHIVARNM